MLTLVFPDSLSNKFSRNAPLAKQVPMLDQTSAFPLPSTSNPLYPNSQDCNLAFSVLFDETSTFLREVQELPNEVIFPNERGSDVHRTTSWVMKASNPRGNPSQTTMRKWGSSAWTSFVDLVKVFCSPNPIITGADKTLSRTQRPWISSLWSSDISRCISRSSHCSCRCDVWDRISGWQQRF